MKHDNIVRKVDNYYTGVFEEYNEGPLAADWNSKEAQQIRFDQLSRLLPSKNDSHFSICDFGCGLGDYHVYLQNKYKSFNYTGIDVSAKVIECASATREGKYMCDSNIRLSYDYIVASGIFNVRQDTGDDEWKEYILSTISMFARYANEGFAFNCLTMYSDEDRMKDYLYYADPLFLFDFCKKHFSKNVSLLHDYDIYDFTILVRRDNTWHGKN